MTRIDVPTHLRTRDKFLLGLSGVQVILCLGAVSAAWLCWLVLPWPLAVRVGLALVILGVGLLLALIEPAGRTLDDWAAIVAGYAARPRRRRYRKGERD
jgi:hypothetical protein